MEEKVRIVNRNYGKNKISNVLYELISKLYLLVPIL